MAPTALPYRQFVWRFIVMTATVLLGMALIACIVGCKRPKQPRLIHVTPHKPMPPGCNLAIGEKGDSAYVCWSEPYSPLVCPKGATCIE